jgi:chromosome segregation protein
VSLTFKSDEPIEGASDDGTLTLGRRVFRSGEGQYRLNDKLVRLKDIKDILMDTGLGVRAYSVIEQGRIGMILSGKPQDRRKLIEEAAGVTRYKQRKRIAELKLEDATGNLMRLDDIVSEVERALRSLKRQANAAMRYTERESEYRTLLEQALLGRWSMLHGQLGSLQQNLDAALEQDAERASQLTTATTSLAAARERLEELGRSLAQKHQAQAELAARIQGRQEFAKATRERRAELAERLQSGASVSGQREVELRTVAEAVLTLTTHGENLTSQRLSAHEAVQEDQQRLEAAAQKLKSAEAELESKRSQLLSSVNRINSYQTQLHQQQIESEKGSYRQDHLKGELSTRLAALDQANADVAEAEKQVQRLETETADLTRQRDQNQAALDRVLADEAESIHRRQEAQAAVASLTNRRSVLQELARAETERRRRIQEVLTARGFEHLSFLDDEIDVPAGWETSLDLFLGQIRDALLVPADDDGEALAAALVESDASATLLRESLPSDRWVGERPWDAAIVSSLGEALGLPRSYADSLPPAYLVIEGEDAQRLASIYPGVAFISQDGLLAQSGVLHLHGERSAPGTLARNREMLEIAQELPRLAGIVDTATTTIERLVEDRSERAEQISALDKKINGTKQELAVASARRQDVLQLQHRLRLDSQTLESEQTEILRELERLGARRSSISNELETAQAAHAELEEEFDRAQQQVEAARQEREALKAEGAGREGHLALLEERVVSHGAESKRLQRQRDEILQSLAGWQEEQARLEQRDLELASAIEQAEQELAEASAGRESVREETLEHQRLLDEQRLEVRRLESELDSLRDQRDRERTQIEEMRVRQATHRQEAEHLKTSFGAAFDRELPQHPEPAPDNLEEIEQEAKQLKAEIDRLGPVNVLAAHEYAEQEERFSFLSEQRQDVVASIRSLRSTIKEINETSLDRFIATFEEVNERFGVTFTHLFQGGEALMNLMDEDDPLESGIEIIARPPGKRPQNINLLSGGEKALTAIALLFALFKTKPSPFCILDEVDAPLDDANVLRFVRTLQEMSSDTQFLIITHNKLTMEAASRLYGVTMEEKGVSKLVGVDVEKLHPSNELQAS